MTVEYLHNVTGIFKNCHLEFNGNSMSLFDAKNRFICLITPDGVSLSDEYEHSKILRRKLAEKGIPFWSDEISEELKIQQIIDQLPPEQPEDPEEFTPDEPADMTEAAISLYATPNLPDEAPF